MVVGCVGCSVAFSPHSKFVLNGQDIELKSTFIISFNRIDIFPEKYGVEKHQLEQRIKQTNWMVDPTNASYIISHEECGAGNEWVPGHSDSSSRCSSFPTFTTLKYM